MNDYKNLKHIPFRKINILLIILFFMGLIFTGCEAPLNIDFPPPAVDTPIEEIVPDSIMGMPAVVYEFKLDQAIQSANVYYGDDSKIIMTLIVTESNGTAGHLFNLYTADIEEQQETIYNNIGNQKYARFSKQDQSQWFIWTNHRWIFQVIGKNQDFFNAAIEAFDYVTF